MVGAGRSRSIFSPVQEVGLHYGGGGAPWVSGFGLEQHNVDNIDWALDAAQDFCHLDQHLQVGLGLGVVMGIGVAGVQFAGHVVDLVLHASADVVIDADLFGEHPCFL